jgi:hypothetical protein
MVLVLEQQQQQQESAPVTLGSDPLEVELVQARVVPMVL